MDDARAHGQEIAHLAGDCDSPNCPYCDEQARDDEEKVAVLVELGLEPPVLFAPEIEGDGWDNIRPVMEPSARGEWVDVLYVRGLIDLIYDQQGTMQDQAKLLAGLDKERKLGP